MAREKLFAFSKQCDCSVAAGVGRGSPLKRHVFWTEKDLMEIIVKSCVLSTVV
jgi:hypothetical protein